MNKGQRAFLPHFVGVQFIEPDVGLDKSSPYIRDGDRHHLSMCIFCSGSIPEPVRNRFIEPDVGLDKSSPYRMNR